MRNLSFRLILHETRLIGSRGELVDVAALVVIGLVLIVLAPVKHRAAPA
jgi:hypothetical protein